MTKQALDAAQLTLVLFPPLAVGAPPAAAAAPDEDPDSDGLETSDRDRFCSLIDRGFALVYGEAGEGAGPDLTFCDALHAHDSDACLEIWALVDGLYSKKIHNYLSGRCSLAAMLVPYEEAVTKTLDQIEEMVVRAEAFKRSLSPKPALPR